MERAHSFAFDKVSEIINKSIIQKQKVLKLTELREVYNDSLNNTPYANSDYRSEKLKDKIENHPTFSKQVSFLSLNNTSKFESHLVYNSRTSVETALHEAYTLGNLNAHENMAKHIHSAILERFHNT